MSKTIDESLIKNVSIYETIKDLIHCSICSCIIVEPQQCNSCENVFCKVCITSWQAKSSTCPMKCKDFKFKDCRLIKNVLSRLIFNCNLKCNKEISYEEYFTHEENCENAKTECPCCKTIVNRKILDLNVYEEKIKILEKEIETLKKELNRKDLEYEFIPDLFNNRERIFITGKGNFLRTITSKNAFPTKFVIKIKLKKLKNPGHVSIGVSDKIINSENKGYLGGDLGQGNWGLAGNGSLGEQGRWSRGLAYTEGDILTISGNSGILTYSVNNSELTKNYSHNLGNKNLYFAISYYYEDDILQLI